MSWDRKLKPIALNDGRNIATLADARELLLALPDRQQRNSQWQYAAELLLYAAEHGGPTADARNQLNRVLTSAGLIRRPQP